MTILTKINSKLFWLITGYGIIFFGCSPAEKISEEGEKETDEIYIFDEVPDSEVLKFEIPPEIENVVYEIQIGAFSTKEKAEIFAVSSSNYLNKELYVAFNSAVNLYIVRLSQEFNSRTDAEKIRNEIWSHENYADAWIVTIKSKK